MKFPGRIFSQSKTEHFENGKQQVIDRSGRWVAHNIILPFGHTISSEIAGDHYRLRRFLQVVADCQPKPFSALRVVDFGCHEGLYSIEFGRQGSTVVGIEGRQIHIDKAEFIRNQLDLKDVSFHCDDVRSFARDKYGRFDVAVCTGILYHLGFEDGMKFLEEICASSNMVIVDTHVGLLPEHAAMYKEKEYWGHEYSEPPVNETDVHDVLKNNGASIGNNISFWLTRGSLFNAMMDFGCTSVFEIGTPAIPGQFFDRVTYVGVKGKPVKVMSAPEHFASENPRHGLYPCLHTAGQPLPEY
jgi:hypothetical protein